MCYLCSRCAVYVVLDVSLRCSVCTVHVLYVLFMLFCVLFVFYMYCSCYSLCAVYVLCVLKPQLPEEVTNQHDKSDVILRDWQSSCSRKKWLQCKHTKLSWEQKAALDSTFMAEATFSAVVIVLNSQLFHWQSLHTDVTKIMAINQVQQEPLEVTT